MRLRTTLRLPREHGAWAMIYVPFALGMLVAGRVNLALLLLLGASSATFFARESLLIWWRARHRGRTAGSAGRMLAVWLALAFLCGLPLVLFYRLYLLVPMAMAGVALLLLNGRQALEHEDRSLGGEILAIAAMALTAPASYYVARGQWGQTAYLLWGLCVVFFVSSVFYIRLRVLNLNARRAQERERVWLWCAAYHGLLFAALLVAVSAGGLQLLVLIAFVPVLTRAFIALVRPAGRVDLKLAGMLEFAWSMLFLACIALAYRGS